MGPSPGQPPPWGDTTRDSLNSPSLSPSRTPSPPPPPSSGLPATSAWAGGRSSASEPVKMRSFEEILAEASANRNILEIHLKKNISNDEQRTKPANLTFDQLGDLIFDHLQIKKEDCLRFNFSTPRYDTREVVLKPGVDISPYIKTLENFCGHTVTTRPQSNNVTKVSFRNVPSNVPDEEIIRLCNAYGTPLKNVVTYEKMNGNRMAGCVGSTRFVEMEITPGKSFNNYYWMEGPLPGDQGCRITVLHSGQVRQCSHCLKTLSEGCPGHGQGKVCKELGTKMTRMSDYMLSVKLNHGYESLKAEFTRKFPTLGNKPSLPMIEQGDDEDNHSLEHPCAPSTKKDEEIAALMKQVEESTAETDELRKKAQAADQKHFQTKRSGDLAKNKISTATECLDMFLSDNLKNENFQEFNPTFHFLVSQYSALLCTPDCYSVDIDKKEVTLNDDLFANLSVLDTEGEDRLSLFKNQLKEKLVLDLSVRQVRRNSSSGVPRPRLLSNSTKRGNPDDISNGKSKLTRPTPVSLPSSLISS